MESKLGHPVHASWIKSILADAGLFTKQPKNVANASSPETIEIRAEHITSPRLLHVVVIYSYMQSKKRVITQKKQLKGRWINNLSCLYYS